MKNKFKITVFALIFMLCSCGKANDTNDNNNVVYNETTFGQVHQSSDTVTDKNTEDQGDQDEISGFPQDMPCPEFKRIEIQPLTDRREIMQSNSFVQQHSFGHYCGFDGGMFFVDLNDGFLYKKTEEGTTLLLDEYVCCLHFYNDKLYFKKGTKEQFMQLEYSYIGSIWEYDPLTGTQRELIEGDKYGGFFTVNEYGIFCNPKGGGAALYNFDGELIEKFTDGNQSIVVLDNYLHIRSRSDASAYLINLDTKETIPSNNYNFSLAYFNGKVLYRDETSPYDMHCDDLLSGKSTDIQAESIYAFEVLDDTLYAMGMYCIYRFDEETAEFVPVESLNGEEHFYYSLFICNDDLYAVVGYIMDELTTWSFAKIDVRGK